MIKLFIPSYKQHHMVCLTSLIEATQCIVYRERLMENLNRSTAALHSNFLTSSAQNYNFHKNFHKLQMFNVNFAAFSFSFVLKHNQVPFTVDISLLQPTHTHTHISSRDSSTLRDLPPPLLPFPPSLLRDSLID